MKDEAINMKSIGNLTASHAALSKVLTESLTAAVNHSSAVRKTSNAFSVCH